MTEVLDIDADRACREIEEAIRRAVQGDLGRRGVVVGLSGGVDSALTAALSARALGPDRVLGVLMPERDSSSESLRLGRAAADALRIGLVLEDIGPALEAMGCYRRQVDAIREAFPEYAEGWRCRLVLPSLLSGDRLSVFRLEVESPRGERKSSRLSAPAYKQLVAATNFKQRTRKMFEYYHADRLGYAVAGTPNRLEFDQGFFVKLGDGAADFKPIAHLYKSQVYALAAHLGVPDEILAQPPTTDTFSMPQTQEEFYFALPYREMDLCLYGMNEGLPPEEVAAAAGLSADQVARVYRDIEAKRRATRYLHAPAKLVRAVQPRVGRAPDRQGPGSAGEGAGAEGEGPGGDSQVAET